MPDPLSPETLARMKAEHVQRSAGRNADGPVYECATCVESGGWSDEGSDEHVEWPCDAAELLAELERVQTPKWWEAFPFSSGPVTLPPGYVLVDPDTAHCHCGAVGMEPAHPRHGR